MPSVDFFFIIYISSPEIHLFSSVPFRLWFVGTLLLLSKEHYEGLVVRFQGSGGPCGTVPPSTRCEPPSTPPWAGPRAPLVLPCALSSARPAVRAVLPSPCHARCPPHVLVCTLSSGCTWALRVPEARLLARLADVLLKESKWTKMFFGEGQASLSFSHLNKDDEGLYTLRIVSRGGITDHSAFLFVRGAWAPGGGDQRDTRCEWRWGGGRARCLGADKPLESRG